MAISPGKSLQRCEQLNWAFKDEEDFTPQRSGEKGYSKQLERRLETGSTWSVWGMRSNAFPERGRQV